MQPARAAPRREPGAPSLAALESAPQTPHPAPTKLQNEQVTYHLLQCIYVHKHLASGGAPSAAGGMGPFGGGGPAYGGGVKQEAAAAAGGGGAYGDVQPLQRAMLVALNERREDPAGVSMEQLVATLATRGFRVSRDAVRAAVEELMGSGHAYTAADDDHFRAV